MKSSTSARPKNELASPSKSCGEMRGTSSAQMTARCMPTERFSDTSVVNSRFCASSGLKSPPAAADTPNGSRLASSATYSGRNRPERKTFSFTWIVWRSPVRGSWIETLAGRRASWLRSDAMVTRNVG